MSKVNVQDLAAQLKPLDPTALPPEEADFEIPAEYEGAPAPPQPQRLTLQLPNSMDSCYELLDCKVKAQDPAFPADPTKTIMVPLSAYQGDDGKRIALRFDSSDVLTIVGETKGGPAGRSYIGEPLWTRIDNREMNRAKKGDPAILVSDLVYLLRAVFSVELEAGQVKLPRRGDNREVLRLLGAAAGRRFSAEWEWTGFCNQARVCQVQVGAETVDWIKEGGVQEMGCGKRVYQSKWPRDAAGFYNERGVCGTQGHSPYVLLRPFGRLRRFQPARG